MSAQEQVQEAAETVGEVYAEVAEFKPRTGVKVGVALFAGVAIGAGAMYLFTKKKLAAEFEERLDREVKESVAYIVENSVLKDKVIVTDEDPDEYADRVNEQESGLEVQVVEEDDEELQGERVFKDADKPSLEQLAQQNQKTRYDKILQEEQYDTTTPDPEEPLVPEGGWDPGEDGDIVVIGKDLFIPNVSGFEQSTLTWFQDGAVVDTESNYVEEHERLIGSNRPPFGQMSDDENIVYIRNKKIQAEYEVIQDPGNASDFLMHGLVEQFRPSRRR